VQQRRIGNGKQSVDARAGIHLLPKEVDWPTDADKQQVKGAGHGPEITAGTQMAAGARKNEGSWSRIYIHIENQRLEKLPENRALSRETRESSGRRGAQPPWRLDEPVIMMTVLGCGVS
jgi:hypothetical protein